MSSKETLKLKTQALEAQSALPNSVVGRWFGKVRAWVVRQSCVVLLITAGLLSGYGIAEAGCPAPVPCGPSIHIVATNENAEKNGYVDTYWSDEWNIGDKPMQKWGAWYALYGHAIFGVYKANDLATPIWSSNSAGIGEDSKLFELDISQWGTTKVRLKVSNFRTKALYRFNYAFTCY